NNTVIAVASVNSQDIKSSFSNYGFECIDLATPGEGLISLSYYDPDNGFEDKYFSNWNGTSFSTAIVSGVAALVKSKNLSYSPSQIISLILNNTNNIDQKNILYQGKLGSGRLNAEAALLADLEAGNGYLAKTAESNSVYFIDNKNKRHLFPQSNIFWSWYRGTWEDQNIEILSVEQFGDLKAGDNVIVRPGTNLIKFKNSSRIYGVSTSGKIHLVSEINAKMLYGDDYKDRLILVQNAFEANYERGSDLPDNGYPDGTLIKYKNSEDIYYLTDDLKRLVMTSGFEVNNFKIEFIVNNVDLKLDFTNGSKIVSWEENIFPYSINNEK
ncbi:MAG TPA: S8 family serine peptidase, partial [Patescibacteria group bacterium]|nr:S8 family serine peptidase [Patescibacteria group bacterium]